MKDTYQPFGPYLLQKFSEAALANPTFLLERLIDARIEMQHAFSTLSPLAFKICSDIPVEPVGHLPPLNSHGPGQVGSPGRGSLGFEGAEVKLVRSTPHGSPTIIDADRMDRSHAASVAVVSASQWTGLDLQPLIRSGHAVITFFDPASQAIPAHQVECVDDVVTLFLRSYGQLTFRPSYDGWGHKLASRTGLLAAIQELSLGCEKAVVLLADEIVALSQAITNELLAYHRPQVENSLGLRLAEACIGEMVSGFRALVFHGYGWPSLDLYDARQFLREMSSKYGISKAKICREFRRLRAADRDVLVAHLTAAGVAKVVDGWRVVADVPRPVSIQPSFNRANAGVNELMRPARR